MNGIWNIHRVGASGIQVAWYKVGVIVTMVIIKVAHTKAQWLQFNWDLNSSIENYCTNTTEMSFICYNVTLYQHGRFIQAHQKVSAHKRLVLII